MKDLDNLSGHLALDSQAELRYNIWADTVRMIGQADPIFYSGMHDTEEAVNQHDAGCIADEGMKVPLL